MPCNCGGNANTQMTGRFEITYPTGGTRIVTDETELKVAKAANPGLTWRKLDDAPATASA